MDTLITIAVVWIAFSYAIAVALSAEQLRRPHREWQAAGHDRRFWVFLTVILGFHGLGQYAAAAYLVRVRPRLRAVRGTRPLEPADGGGALRRRGARGEPAAGLWQRIAPSRPSTAADELVVLAALLVLAAGLIHALVIADHFEEYWLFGVLFAVVAALQALWAAWVYTTPLSRPLLIAGAIGNGALIAVWTLSRTVGVPLGPEPWEPEAVGAVDVLATLDGLLAVILIGAALACMRNRRPAIPAILLRLVTAFTGVLFLFSVLAPFAGLHDE